MVITKLQLRPRINTKRRLQPRLGIMNSKFLLKVSRIPPRRKVMNDLFSDYINDFVIIYMDDILIMSSSPEEHMQHLRLVLDRLRLHRVYAKMSKCHFNQREVKFLGHIVGADGIRVDPAKIAVVKEWPVPTNITELRQFLGLANYFRKYIQGYSTLAAPLTSALSNLSSKKSFILTLKSNYYFYCD